MQNQQYFKVAKWLNAKRDIPYGFLRLKAICQLRQLNWGWYSICRLLGLKDKRSYYAQYKKHKDKFPIKYE